MAFLTSDIIYLVFLSLLFLLIIIGNVLVCVLFFKFRNLRTTTNYFIVSLAASDIFVGLIPMPLWAYLKIMKEAPLNITPAIFVMLDVVTCCSSIGNLTAISIDRFFGVTKPFHHRTYMTENKALMAIVFVYMISIVFASVRTMLSIEYYTYFITGAGILFPILVIIVAYISIFVTVKKRNVNNSDNVIKEWKLAKTIFVVIALFVICWAPFLSINLYYVITFKEISEYLMNGAKWLQYFNSCVNPFVYAVFHEEFNKSFKIMLLKCTRNHNQIGINLPHVEQLRV